MDIRGGIFFEKSNKNMKNSTKRRLVISIGITMCAISAFICFVQMRGTPKSLGTSVPTVAEQQEGFDVKGCVKVSVEQ